MASESGLVRPGAGRRSHTRCRVTALTLRADASKAPDGRLDGVRIYEITPSATTFLAEESRTLGPSRLVCRGSSSSALTWSWLLVIEGRSSTSPGAHVAACERTLRDTYAKGEVDKAGTASASPCEGNAPMISASRESLISV